MNPTIKNILAILAGIVCGSIVNMALVTIGPQVISLPPGTDTTTMEGLAKAMPTFEAKHFIFPFLAHALGTLVGAMVAAMIAAKHKFKFAIGIGCFFLIGGITNVMMLGAPMWFNILDVVVAYIPMAYLGGKMSAKEKVA